VQSVDGTASSVTVTINGTNDAAVISSANVTLAETDAVLSTGGTLTSTDVDNPDDTFVAQTNVAGANGTFNLAADGTWTYVANSAFDSLNVGDSLTDTFTVQSIDGTTSSVTVTINGTDDASVLAADSVTIAEDNVATGNVLTNDSDVDDALTVATFTINGDATTYNGSDTATIAGVGLLLNVAAHGRSSHPSSAIRDRER